MDLRALIEQIVGSDNVVEGSPFASSRESVRLTIYPGDVEELSEVLRLAHRENLTVSPVGAGTQWHAGNSPSQMDLAVSAARLTQLIQYEPPDLTATVKAGMTLAEFNCLAAVNHQWLPLDGPDPRATLGGIIATNAFGSLRTQYGTPRDYVIGLKVVTVDGTLVKTGGRVVKNVAGYDMNKLFVGSHGTLGIIVESSFKLKPVPEFQLTSLVSHSSPQVLTLIGRKLSGPEFSPISVALLDPTGMRTVIPSSSSTNWGLLIRFGDSTEAVEYQRQQLTLAVHEAGGLEFSTVEGKRAESMWAGVNRFETAFDSDITFRWSTLPSRMAEVVDFCQLEFNSAGVDFAVIGHPLIGILRVYMRGCASEEGKITLLAGVVRRCRFFLGGQGSLVVEMAPPSFAQHIDRWGDAPGAEALMRAIKKEFDPGQRLNPGIFAAGI